MRYGKLMTLLLSAIAMEDVGSVNRQIGQYILDHLGDPEAISLKQIASECHVGKSSVSRFCREIGLEDFFELRDLMDEIRYPDNAPDEPDFARRVSEYCDTVCESIDMAARSLREDDIRALCEDIHRYKRVAAFGMLKSEFAILSLQNELAAAGKSLYTVISHSRQMEYLANATEEDLIIIISMRGIFFEYQKCPPVEQLKRPKICFITGGSDTPAGVDRVIRFLTDFDQARHPFQVQFICRVIASEYARLYGTHRL